MFTIRARWHRSVSTVVAAALLTAAAVAGARPTAATAAPAPVGPYRLPSVPVHPAGRPPLTPAQRAAGRPLPALRMPAVTWPSGSATVAVAPAGAPRTGGTTRAGTSGSPVPADSQPTGTAVRAGGLPVRVASRAAGPVAPRTLSIRIAPHAAAERAGVNGVLMTVASADGRGLAPVSITLSYAGFAGAYGGGWADRLTAVGLPSCAATAPQRPACRTASPVPLRNDRASKTITVDITAAPGGTVLGFTSSASGSVGTYTATSLSPEGQWAAGGNPGSFTYSYPIAVPPTVGGSAPSIALSYDSGSVDGRTAATNAQASLIGDGWDYSPGFIERSYQGCAQDGIANSGDLCWAGNLLQLSLAGHSSAIVRDDKSGDWRLQDDDGTKIVHLTNTGNGAWSGEAWEVVTPDGTQFYFGTNYLPGTTATGTATNAAWTEPVYCPQDGDGPPSLPCHTASGTNSVANDMAWRWNLSYVVDPHGNLQTYQWVPEHNYYQRGYGQGDGVGTPTQYVRSGYLQAISYGYRLPDAVAGGKPLATVAFGTAERCLTDSAFTDCGSGNLSASTASHWPDVPFDQMCTTASSTCTNYAPTYFTTKRLTSIVTSVLVGSTYHTVDSYTLDQMFPAPEAGVVRPTSGVSGTNPGDGTVAVMWLNSITRTGADTLGGGAAAAPLATTFVAEETPNRVDGATTGAAALYRPRMASVTTDSGDQIDVTYEDPQCSRASGKIPASADTNSMDCFPQYWVPTVGSSAVLDWFNKLRVSSVTVADLVAPAGWSQPQVTAYSYAGVAWHRDDSPLTPAKQRTWNQFRGYQTVTTTTGTASATSVPTQTVTTYLQGMDGDHLGSGATRSVTVHDSVGDAVTDSDWLQGKVLESQARLGASGTVERKTVGGPWSYAVTTTQNQSNSMPALVARMATAAATRSYNLWHDGSWHMTEVDTTYDSAGRAATVDAKGDGTATVPEVCTSTTYAQDTNRGLLSYPDEVKAVRGGCGTAATAANTVGDTRTYYDGSTTLGALPAAGDPTTVQEVDSYDAGGTPVYVTEKTATYDAYGRVTLVTDADGHTTKTAYTTPGTSPDTVTVTNPKGWTSSTTLDPGRGRTVAASDVNGELTTMTYDGLGELTAVWSPLHSQAAKAPADRTFGYVHGGVTAPSSVSTSALLDDGTYDTDVKIYDGSLRLIQDQMPTVDGAAGRLLSDTHYNSLGQVDKATSPYVDGKNAPSGTVAVPGSDSAIPQETQTSYDGLGRTVQTLTVAKGVNQWATATAYRGTDETDTTPPAGGTASSIFTDELGRTTAGWRYNTATPTGNAADAIITRYTYMPSGKPATIADNAGNTWSYGYDLHGRQTKLVDPGAGTSTTTYSPGGEILSTTDGRGSQLTYTYDALGRKTARYNTTGGVAPAAANELASWAYDSPAKGQPTAQTRYTNGYGDAAHTYTETTAGYTPLYQSTGTTVTVPSSEGTLAGTYQSVNLYSDQTSRLSGVHYYAEGGLPREAVNYGYTPTGLISTFGGTYSYLNAVSYDELGMVHVTNFGVLNSQLSRSEQYDESTHRLLKVTDQVQSASTAVDTTSYAYNQIGSVTAESAAPGTGPADTQCFGYDAQNRLTAAWTDSNGIATTSATPSTPVAGLGGCVDTGPVAGTVTGGPAPYWQSYGYDPLGDRTMETEHDTSVTGTAGDTTQTLAYNGNGTTAATQPDAVQSVTTASAAGTTTSSYTYDTAGNTKTRTGQSFGYDPEGHVQSVTTGNLTTGYLYAPDGSLLVQRDPAAGQVILYLPYGEEIHLNTTTKTVSGLRFYDQSPDGIRAVRSSSGTVSYELADKLGTATATVDAGTLATRTRYFDPFGNPRGTVPAGWPDQHAFLGQPQDPSTGLDLLGARQYDPATGRFVTVDPLLEPGDSRQMNGYSYAADNPVDNSDPAGTRALGDDPGSNCDWHGNCSSPPSSGGGSGGGGGFVGDDWWNDPGQNPPDTGILIKMPGGRQKTLNGNADVFGHALPANVLDSFRRQGYGGSANFTYADALAWASQSENGWDNFCQLSGFSVDECKADPFTHNHDIYKEERSGGLVLLAMIGLPVAVVGGAACLAGAEACVPLTIGSVAIGSTSEALKGEPPSTIVRNAVVEMIIGGYGKLFEAGMTYKDAVTGEKITVGGFEELGHKIAANHTQGLAVTTKAGLTAVRGMAGSPDFINNYRETSALFDTNGEGDVDETLPVILWGSN